MTGPSRASVAVRPATDDAVATIDRFVPHVSTVPANRGQTVGLHLREKTLPGAGRPVVLFIHGGYSPSAVACASHFMQYERARHLLHRATCEWLETGAIGGTQRGELHADAEGRLQKLQAKDN